MLESEAKLVAKRVSGFRFAGLTIRELRRRYLDELFNLYLPFWEKYGIDHQFGGFMCSLDHDGTLVNSDKLLWFQGRGLWVYSFLYQHFGRNSHHLEIARKAKEFLLSAYPQSDGWWAELVSREGKVLRPFSGDVYGMFFAAEGLQEYAAATGDDKARALAAELLKKLYAYINQADFRDAGKGKAGQRPLGLWMLSVRVATQMLRRWPDAEINVIADAAVEAVINKHYNPEIGLNTEVLNFDFTRPADQANLCVLGHSVETLWMVMDEALRRHDRRLYDTCVERVRRHLDVGWDHVYGGLASAVNVGEGCYQWPVERPVGTNLEFREVGEFSYVKTSWAMDETLIATLNILEHTGEAWAARYFDLAQEAMDKKFSVRPYGFSLWMIFSDRRFTFQPHTARQENYHRPRQYMLGILALDRLMARSTQRESSS